MNKVEDLSGQLFGNWKVLKFAFVMNYVVANRARLAKRSAWFVECRTCGAVAIKTQQALKVARRNRARACGACRGKASETKALVLYAPSLEKSLGNVGDRLALYEEIFKRLARDFRQIAENEK